MSDWHLAQTKPNADHIAARNLERQGFVTFRPLERRKVARGTRVIEQVRSFFPGYIFIRCSDDIIPLSRVNSTCGITKLVMFGQTPSRVPANVINELQGACDEEGIISPHSGLITGSTVQLIAGSFAGFVGTLIDLSPSQRALVVLDCMGREVKLSVPRAQVQAAYSSLHRQV